MKLLQIWFTVQELQYNGQRVVFISSGVFTLLVVFGVFNRWVSDVTSDQ